MVSINIIMVNVNVVDNERENFVLIDNTDQTSQDGILNINDDYYSQRN